MDQKEANARSYNNKKSHKIYTKKKLNEYRRKEKNNNDIREIIKKISHDKPQRSNSCGYQPRNKIDVGNSGKIVCCNYCFHSLNNKLQKRHVQKMDFKEAIKLVTK